MAIGQQM